MSTTISSLVEANEYILYILSAFDVAPSFAQARYSRIISGTADISSPLLSNREVQVHIAPSTLDNTSTFDRTLEIRTENEFDLSQSISKQYTLSIPSVEFPAYGTFYGDLIIGDYANTPISTFSAFSFDSFFTSDPNVTGSYAKTIKITGTVTFSGNTVIGTGTSFANNFSVDDSFIVNDEKFIVKSVANSTYLQVNVNPVGSYTNVLAYKQEVA
jgi:hypothetical protein